MTENLRPCVVTLAASEIDFTESEALANGDVVKWIPLAMAGEEWQNGPHKFDITDDTIGQAIKNFEARGSQPLPVTIGHVNDSSIPAAAWIEDIKQGDPHPMGKVRFLKPTADLIREGKYKYFSLEFVQKSKDGKGEDIGFQIVGGGIVNDPFFPIRVDAGAGGAALFRLSRFGTNGGHGRKEQGTMTAEEKAAADKAEADRLAAEKIKLDQVKIEGDRVTLTRTQFDTLMKANRETETLRGQLATSEDEKQTLGARVTKLERRDTANKIRAAVERLQGDGVIVQLGDFVLKNDQDCFDWLAGAPWGVTTAEGLDKLSTDREQNAHLPRIRLNATERAGGTDRLPPVDLTTEAGRNEAVRRRVAELRRQYTKTEIETQLNRRGQTEEDLARAELAADHPTYRKMLLDRK